MSFLRISNGNFCFVSSDILYGMLNYEFNVNIIVQLSCFQCFAVASDFLTQRTTSGVSHCKRALQNGPIAIQVHM